MSLLPALPAWYDNDYAKIIYLHDFPNPSKSLVELLFTECSYVLDISLHKLPDRIFVLAFWVKIGYYIVYFTDKKSRQREWVIAYS